MKTSNSRTATKKSAAKKSTTTKKSAAPARKSAPAKKAAPRKSAVNTSATAGNERPTSHNDLEKIFKDILKDIFWAEKNLTKGLKKMAKNASSPELRDAFNLHLAQTEEQISMLEDAFGMLGMRAQGKKCAAMEGLLTEADEHIEEYEKGPGLDAALIVGAQKIEHYEIASYGSLRSLAEVLGYDDCATIFEEIKQQEEETDDILTDLAGTVNAQAVGAHEEDESDEEEDESEDNEDTDSDSE